MPGKLASSGDAPPAIIVDSAPSGEDDPFMFFAGDPPMGPIGGLDASPTPSNKPSMPTPPKGERGGARLCAPRLLVPSTPPVLNMEVPAPGPYQLLVPRPNGDGAAPDAPIGDIIEWRVASNTAAAAAAAAAGLTP